jgi:hypothetical protein
MATGAIDMEDQRSPRRILWRIIGIFERNGMRFLEEEGH